VTATVEIPTLEFSHRARRASAKVDAIGTRLRLRALAAMGHSDARIARALGESPRVVTTVMSARARTVSAEMRADVAALYEAWWDKKPPGRTPAERAAAAAARTRARHGGWCAGAGLDDDELDTPGYAPRCTWRPATGTGVADDYPLGAIAKRRTSPDSRTEVAR
jgi:hypothetical protein